VKLVIILLRHEKVIEQNSVLFQCRETAQVYRIFFKENSATVLVSLFLFPY